MPPPYLNVFIPLSNITYTEMVVYNFNELIVVDWGVPHEQSLGLPLKCIYDKISEEEIECCPICNIKLGCVPLEKLRPDHTLQDVRAKIFPFKRRKVKAPEVVAAVTIPVRRKERSLSSLVVSTPRVSNHTTMTGRRTKAVARKAAVRGSSFSVEKLLRKRKVLLSDSNKETENVSELWEGKLDLWKPLNCLVEVANRTKSFKPNSQGPDNKVEPKNVIDNEPPIVKPKSFEGSAKRESASEESRISPQSVLDAASIRHERRIGPVWLSLIASEDQEALPPLPQIPAIYLRIKNGDLPVSFIQKYLMRKLELTSEAEVEIKCMGQPLVPTLPLHNLVELWLKTASTPVRIPATIGSSAKDFVMVLTYAHKVPES
ncbi:hypothetical protein FNV43_RR23302 [Rhamnella rubrinervis]|uniref:E3 ubiquitin protein ligase DRIP2-like n=1 Tax=Rhamnella rubrinervis TaxID=2594499 RepID=A0A8K0GVW2_9ROSA|nr:hypothetical protein FNV43_RR23302 [Rhamnella rubrinervis]